MKRIAMLLTDFRSAALALAGVLALFPQTWTWAAEVRKDAPAVRESLAILAEQQKATQAQIEMLREMVRTLHTPVTADAVPSPQETLPPGPEQ